MRKLALGILGAGVVLFACAVGLLRHYRVSVLGPAALASKPIAPPASWADDCGRLLRAVRNYNRHAVETHAMLSADEVAIYRAVLQNWNNTPSLLNLSDTTIALDTTSSMGISDCACLAGFDVQSLVSASHSLHRLTPDVFSASNIRLVDANRQIRTVQKNDPRNWIGTSKSVRKAVDDAFASGLFSVSEIAFDKQHRRALVMYTFVCGSLCGSGGAWLFENIEGVWKKTDHLCGGWVS